MTAATTTSATGNALDAHRVHVPQPMHLAAEITRIASLGRNEAVAAWKLLRQSEAQAIAAWQLAHLGEVTGQDVTGQLTGLADEIVRDCATRAAAKAGAPATWSQQVSVLAVGGYGRGEMNPFSDLDVLVLSLGKVVPSWQPAFWAEFQTMCWDVKFTVGASQRTTVELARILDDDFVTATAVLEWRPLVGGGDTAMEVERLLTRFRERRTKEFLLYKLQELNDRRAKAGVSLFLMEPNLKSNPGCLRDVQLLRNIASMVSGSRNLLTLTELDSFTGTDLADVNAANDHLLALRSMLHFHHGRKQDVFQLPDQVRIAKHYGWSDVSRLRAVEHFMKAHYAKVRHVHQMVDLAISRLTARGHLGRRPILIKGRKSIDDDFSVIQSQVYFAHAGFWEANDAGARLIRMCREAQRRNAGLSLELQRDIRANLHRIDDKVRHDREIARVFLAMLGDLGRTRQILSDMHACGLLGAYIPEFGNLTCLMQFDSYHQYTVDEHTLIAMGNLDAVATGKLQGLPGMQRLLPQVARKDLLALSLLLHDMGKYMGRGHVPRGALMVEGVAERFGLTDGEEDFVHFLVDRHVALSDASRMRDFHEPRFLREFADRMGTIEHLDALYCLTYCDAKAVGEGIMTGWQEAILGELREAIAGQLAGGAVADTRHQRLHAQLLAGGVSSTDASAFLDSLSNTYEHQVQLGDIVHHVLLIREAHSAGIGMRYEVADSGISLTAVMPDRHGLLADVAATLSGYGFDIIACRTWVTTPSDGSSAMVIYTFRLSTIFPARVKEADSWDKLQRDLLAVSRGACDSQAMLEKRRSTVVTKPADSGFDDPAIKVEQRTSDHFTIVDVHIKDEVGLLSRLTRTISEVGCDIGYAGISTMGDVAVDVFYVSRKGTKLNDEQAAELRIRLMAGLGLAPLA